MRRRRFWLLGFAVALACSIALPAHADKVVLKNGHTLEGKITRETDQELSLQTKDGLMTLAKKLVKEILRTAADATPASSKGGKTGGATSGPAAVRSATADLALIPRLDDPVARVGAGGISRREFEIYLTRRAREAEQDVAALNTSDRREVLQQAIEDEIVYQCALEDGMLRDEYVRDRIVQAFRSRNTTAQIDPRTFTEEELRAYYDAHPETFTIPAAVNLEYLEFERDTPIADLERSVATARTEPTTLSGWKPGGWLKPGDQIVLALPELAEVLRLPVGGVSNPIKNMSGNPTIFRVKEKEEPRLPDFADIREKVRFHLIGQKQQELERGLSQSLAQTDDGLDENERLFRAALQAGQARDFMLRKYIINAYLARLGHDPSLKDTKPREEVMPPLRARCVVEIIDG